MLSTLRSLEFIAPTCLGHSILRRAGDDWVCRVETCFQGLATPQVRPNHDYRPVGSNPIAGASIFFKAAMIWCKRAAGARSSLELLLIDGSRASVSVIRACPWAREVNSNSYWSDQAGLLPRGRTGLASSHLRSRSYVSHEGRETRSTYSTTNQSLARALH